MVQNRLQLSVSISKNLSIFPKFREIRETGNLTKIPEANPHELLEFSSGKFPDLRPLVLSEEETAVADR